MLLFILAVTGILHAHLSLFSPGITSPSVNCKVMNAPVVIINEIHFDPAPVRSLPDLEYVELYNAGAEAVNLVGWKLNQGILPDFLLKPGEFLIVCRAGKEDILQSFGKTAGIQPWDVLNNEGQEVRLENDDGMLVDSFFYSPALIRDEDKKNGGWSIELINPEHTCKGKINWGVSINPAGGTPGKVNSIYSRIPDSDPPVICGLEWISGDSLQIVFSEPLDNKGGLHSGSFVFIPVIQAINTIYDVHSPDKVVVVLKTEINAGVIYNLRVSGIFDCLGNKMYDTLIHTGKGRRPYFNELLITELMIDENPPVGLPESEYIELVNAGSSLLELGGTRLLNSKDTFQLPQISLFPGQYLVLCPQTRMDLFQDVWVMNLQGISPFPRLLNEHSLLALINDRNQLVFSIHYDISWYNDLEKSTGGYSLEMIDLMNPCGDSHNWRASDNPAGGTPGYPNSVSEANPDLSGPAIKNVYMPGPRLLQVDLTEKLHPASLAGLEIIIPGSGDFFVSSFDSVFFDSFDLVFPDPLSASVRYEIQVGGIRDCAGNIMETSRAYFVLPRKADPGDLIINEILFNPRPGGVDWVEIYNRSSDYIDLSDVTLAGIPEENNKNIINETRIQRIIPPSGLMVYTENRNKLLADFPESREEAILEFDHMPDMPDQFGEISLVAGGKNIVDQLSYSSDFHHTLIRDDEGISLERISAIQPTNDPENWQSASSLYGYGSPTFENPNQAASGTGDQSVYLDQEIFSPDGDGFQDKLTIHFSTGLPGYSATVEVHDVGGRPVKSILKNSLVPVSGSLSWDGYDNQGRVPSVGIYILRFEIYNLQGDFRRYKKRFVIAGKR